MPVARIADVHMPHTAVGPQAKLLFYVLKELGQTIAHTLTTDGGHRLTVRRPYLVGEGKGYNDAVHDLIRELEEEGHNIKEYTG
jgi:hypothetical protein